MLRMLLVALLGLPPTVVAWADDPKPKADPKPQWQRLLTGDDAKKAAELQKQVDELDAADKHEEAIRAAEELLTLRTRAQGADHWETALLKWRLTAMKKVAALPDEKRLGWRKAAQGAHEGERLFQQAEYARALALWQERLKWCREVFGEDHPDTAIGYQSVAIILRHQGKYAEAAALCQKSLDIRRKTLGESHPETAQGYMAVAISLDARGNYADAEPLHRRALDINRKALGEGHVRTGESYNSLAANLHSQAKYAEATPLYQKALDIFRKDFGEDHSFTAAAYNNVALNLKKQGKYAEAGPLYQKALDIQRKVLGEDHPSTAETYNNLALNLSAQGKYAEAGPLLQKALDIKRKVLGEDHPRTALSYGNLARHLYDQGKYIEAAPLGQKALDINRKVLGENHPSTAINYCNVALNLQGQRKYAEAGPLLQKALDIFRKTVGEDHPYTANAYTAMARNLNGQGKYAEATPLWQKALDIRRRILGEDHPDVAEGLHNLAFNLDGDGRWAEAGPLLQKALDISRKVLGENHPNTANELLHLAVNLHRQGHYAEALTGLEQAARSHEAARLAGAISALERAAQDGRFYSPHIFLAAARARAGQAAGAWAALEADLGQGLRDDTATRAGIGLTPAERRQCDELRGQRTALEARVLALVSQPERTDAEAAELGRLIEERRGLEKVLADVAAAVSRREVATLEQLQAALPADAAFVTWIDIPDQHGAAPEHWGCVVRSRGEPMWEPLPGSGPDGKWVKNDAGLPEQFCRALARSAPAADVEVLARKLHDQRLAPLARHLTGVKRLFVVPVDEMAGVPVEVLADRYTVSYTPSGTYLARLKNRERPRTAGVLAVGDPEFPPMKEATQTIALPPGGLLITLVVPDSAAAKARLQPGDVLVAYAGEDLTSGEQLGKLITAKAGEKSVVVKVWREGQQKLTERDVPPGRLGVLLAREPAREAIAARRQADQMLAKLTRGDDYAELPGSQVEIAGLAALFNAKSVKTLTRAEATEERLDELRKSGELKQFLYLHLATHGKANDVRAFESALILTKPAKPPELRVDGPYLDGRLTAAEVRDYWKLDAELVTLSACESGLGRHGGGDGLLGFAQAFLLAGSRSVCLSLWQVDDTATALLMDRFYRNLLGRHEDGARPMPKAEALREAKHWLRNLTATEALDRLGAITQGVVRGEQPAREEMKAVPQPKDGAKDYKPYAHPRYWAAFILIGDPE
jgi:tetratricopeptide (TPR) repeat protein